VNKLSIHLMKSRLIQWEFQLTTEFRVQPHIFDMRSPCPRSLSAKALTP